MINEFLDLLRKHPSEAVFNPWWQVDIENDNHKRAYLIRQKNLRSYISERLGLIEYIMLAEALGYQGGHFTGIPMTSERLLLGELEKNNIFAKNIFTGNHQRTSKQKLGERGFNEPTATIVWSELVQLNLTHKTLLWNSFPWHPFHKEKGLLSNRTPSHVERRIGREVLKYLIEQFPSVKILAIGRQAEQQLAEINKFCIPLRHPAHGGANLFRNQLQNFISGQ
jgi:hypothetical protein